MPLKRIPYGTGHRFGAQELAELKDALDYGSLAYWCKHKVTQFCEKAKATFGAKYCAGCSSGSAAIHAAIASLEIPPGHEVITSPITDMGSIIGIIYENLIPVFADVEPHTYNITAESVEKAITPRTRAIIPVHLAGAPCDMDSILEVAGRHGLPVIEDCAQAYGALYHGRHVGNFGAIGCFSLNDSKHLSAGEGGFAITDDERLYGLLHNNMDKFYDRLGQGNRLRRVAPNYRASELQYAVGLAQLGRLEALVEARRRYVAALEEGLGGIPGVTPPSVLPDTKPSWWFYMIRLQPGRFRGDGPRFAEALRAEGVPAMAGYIPRPIYREALFADKSFFPGGIWPAEILSGQSYSYPAGLCPVAEEVLATAIRLPVSEFFTVQDARDTAAAIRKVAQGLG
ncbi:MAG: DegT/DnrJ/EryC1/StrS family aminotransferase [Victivallales bacterium]|nr:DegT/DnrJ/EryC1/StrS family aminotransferase [Victivallales bacterium]